MITEKIKQVFEFIDFLHDNIIHLGVWNSKSERIESIKMELNILKPSDSFHDKEKSIKLKEEKNSLIEYVKRNVSDVIIDKAISLNIAYKEPQKGGGHWIELNWDSSEIGIQKEKAVSDDLETINNYKKKYVKYRNENNSKFGGLSCYNLIKDLDELLLDVFQYFDENTKNDFKPFYPPQLTEEQLKSNLEIHKIFNGKKEPKKQIKNDMEQIGRLDFDLNQSEVIYLFDILISAGLMKMPGYQNGSYYRKLERYFTAQGVNIKDAEQKRNKLIPKGGVKTSEEIISKLKHILDNPEKVYH